MSIKCYTENKSYSNNTIKRTDGSFFLIPIRTMVNYFFWNYENIYFLIISIFQLLTISILPREWSPTGPFSTAVPLGICVLVEIIKNMYIWFQQWKLDSQENNKEYTVINNKFISIKKKSSQLYAGDIICLNKEDICPIDGILIDFATQTVKKSGHYVKISQAMLTGESNIIHISKPATDLTYNNLLNASLEIKEYYQNNFNNIDASIVLSDSRIIPVTGHNFIVAGAIIKTDNVYILTVRCGSQKKSYVKYKNTDNSELRKTSRIDEFVGQYMINVNARILFFLVMILSFLRLSISQNYTIKYFFFFVVQNWILFNGIIPFSVKIFLILARSIQGIIASKNVITVNNSLQIDDFGKIQKIISDKTGTLTKNELEFSKLIQTESSNIIDIETYNESDTYINLEFHKCLGVCIHEVDENLSKEYATAEDKTIRYRYGYLGNSVIQQNDNHITLHINNKSHCYDFEYIELAGLDFTFERRMSSKIVRDKIKNTYYLYCKGAISTIEKKLISRHTNELNRLDTIISNTHPEMRLLACAYREILEHEVQNLHLDHGHSKLINQLENNLHLLGIIGIKDNLQIEVPETVDYLRSINIEVSLCTGDRKITAMAVAREANIITNKTETNDIVDIYYNNENVNIPNINEKTLIFSGQTLDEYTNDSNNREYFYDMIAKCKNFVGYGMIPEHKMKLTNIMEERHVKLLAIGDGFNDIGMFKTVSIGVAIKGNNFVEHSADFAIKEFRNLMQLINLSIDCYNRNSKLINFVFYRCSAVFTAIATNILLNYTQPTISIFNGFVMQAFNFFWAFLGLAYYTGYQNDKSEYTKTDFANIKLLSLTSYRLTTIWNICGMLTGNVIVLIIHHWFSTLFETDVHIYNDIIGLLIITVINIKIINTNKLKKIGILMSLLGPFNFCVYMLINNNLFDVLSKLIIAPTTFWAIFISSIFTINLIFQ